jgi:hypothetical protein
MALAAGAMIVALLGRLGLVVLKRVRARSARTPVPASASSEVMSPPDPSPLLSQELTGNDFDRK